MVVWPIRRLLQCLFYVLCCHKIQFPTYLRQKFFSLQNSHNNNHTWLRFEFAFCQIRSWQIKRVLLWSLVPEWSAGRAWTWDPCIFKWVEPAAVATHMPKYCCPVYGPCYQMYFCSYCCICDLILFVFLPCPWCCYFDPVLAKTRV